MFTCATGCTCHISSQTDYYALAGHLIGSTNGTTTTSSLTDAQGSLLTSLSASALTGEQLYAPYGPRRYTIGTPGTAKAFTGQEADPLTGLYYYHARWYDPVVGLFLSVDTQEGNAQGVNPYAYVRENPETATDPTGERVAGCQLPGKSE
jgi:RHS repeat-associated protein